MTPPEGGAVELTCYEGVPPAGDTVYELDGHVRVHAGDLERSRAFWHALGFAERADGLLEARAMLPGWRLAVELVQQRSCPARNVRRRRRMCPRDGPHDRHRARARASAAHRVCCYGSRLRGRSRSALVRRSSPSWKGPVGSSWSCCRRRGRRRAMSMTRCAGSSATSRRTASSATGDVQDVLDENYVTLELLDSLGIVQLLVGIEEQFGVWLDPAEMQDPRFCSIAGLAALVEESRWPPHDARPCTTDARRHRSCADRRGRATRRRRVQSFQRGHARDPRMRARAGGDRRHVPVGVPRGHRRHRDVDPAGLHVQLHQGRAVRSGDDAADSGHGAPARCAVAPSGRVPLAGPRSSR